MPCDAVFFAPRQGPEIQLSIDESDSRMNEAVETCRAVDSDFRLPPIVKEEVME